MEMSLRTGQTALYERLSRDDELQRRKQLYHQSERAFRKICKAKWISKYLPLH
ncbi:hypothetical protein EV204_12020 [Tissierella praeacuta]|nr:hypothetical protein EV204_12020 [Tissierella praeacuta]